MVISDAAITNVALRKPVKASSLWHPVNPAYYIVDGDTSSTFGPRGHCGISGNETKPYFIIDLGKSYNIESFELWVRDLNQGNQVC